MKELKVLSLFSGIGAFEKALDRTMTVLGGGYSLVNYCEIDKHASKSYQLIHNVSEDLNLHDVTQIDTSKLPNDIDLITHGSPCQDFSLAGRQAGGDEGSGTRSSLMYETIRIVKDTMPKIVVWENVKNVLSKKHKHNFDAYIEALNEIGYNSYYKVLNAKDYGVPQNRERIFVVSIRKDIDNGKFEFPKPVELKLRLKDMLEDNVDESYYLSEDKISKIARWKAYQKPFKRVLGNNSVSPTLTARGAGEEHSGMVTFCDELDETTDLQEYCLNVKNENNEEPHYNIKEATKKGYKEAYEGDSVNFAYPNSEQRRGRVGKQIANTILCNNSIGVVVKEPKDIDTTKCVQVGDLQKYKYESDNRVYSPIGVSPCLRAKQQNSQIDVSDEHTLKIRKLTPRECWRLMGFDDGDFDKVKDVMPRNQLYKQAGNSIVVNVLEGIYTELFKTGIFE